MDKLEAIKYLNENDIGHDEWSEAGMWHAVIKILKGADLWTEDQLKALLVEADKF